MEKWNARRNEINSDKYKNNEGVYIDAHTDKSGKDHVSFYDKDPSDSSHSSIHVNWDSETGKGSIVDTISGDKESTDISCFLTTACMRHFQDKFDDNCYELRVLRWFRDNFISQKDIEYYYKIAPIIVETINKEEKAEIIYDYIYDNVVDYCVEQIEQGNYEAAYSRYKNSFLTLEEQFAKPALINKFVKTLKLRINNKNRLINA